MGDPMKPYDLVVIGGGSAGLTAAGFAAQLGKKVALVEKSRIGGDCTWTGCVLSKTLLKSAKVAHQMRTADRYGIRAAAPKIDFSTVMGHVQRVVAEVYESESPESLRAQGIDVFLGSARFADPHTIVVGDTNLTARRVLLATGARPLIPPIAGLESAGYLTYETIWDLEALPQHLLVVGGGPIGCELAQAFRRLGAEVTLIEAASRILLQDEPEASELLMQELVGEGINVLLNRPAEQPWQDANGIHLESGDKEIQGDSVLIAAGRGPSVADLGLEQAGVEYSPHGIQVNQRLQTSQRHIYAAGDCIGGYQFTHYAGWQGFMAVRNALLPGVTRAVLDQVPWATFTEPEVAHAGLTETQARERFSNRVEVSQWPMARVDRALAERDTSGFIKLVHQRDGTLLGVTIVNGRAGEMIHEWILAIDQRMKIADLANSIHIYPTYSMASLQLASQLRVAQLLGGASGSLIRAWSRLMR